jgi:hypothetical protein
LNRRPKVPAAVAPRRRKNWRNPGRFALPGAAKIRASVSHCGGPPPLFPNFNPKIHFAFANRFGQNDFTV